MSIQARPPFCALLAFTVSAAFIYSGDAHAASRSGLVAAAPEGFEALGGEREVVLDAYYGGRKVGQVRATISPGLVRLNDPGAVAGLVPDVARVADLAAFLSGSMSANSARACGAVQREDCGVLPEGYYGVILDEDRFRLDIFVAPQLLRKPDPSEALFLPAPDEAASLVSLFGVTASGSDRGGETLHVQNRSIASLGRMRMRSDSSVSSDTGLTIDNLTVETDRGDWRYAGGLFWAPGSELIGRRKMLGLGAATQLDTRQNKDALLGTPVSIFLQRPAKVDLLVDGRVVSSRIYSAGNKLIDTAALPNGSYELVVRVQEDGRPPREEPRFFTKGASMAPIGRPLFSAAAGLLPSSGRGLSFDQASFFYELTAAYRLAPALGVDAVLIGTQKKAIIEGGATYHLPWAQIRAAALVSTSSDYGAVLRLNSVGQSPFSYSVDLRKVVSGNGGPLLPVTASRGTFSDDPESGFADRGSYTQALSILGYHVGQANVRVTGLYRRSSSDKAAYSVGAAIDLPVVRTGRFDVVIQADARRTERDFASFIGARFLFNRGGFAFSGSGGISHQSQRSGANNRPVGEVQAAWSRELADHSQVAGDVAVGRDADGSYARASAYAQTPLVNARADLLQQFGAHRTTQYAATLDGGFVIGTAGIGVAGKDINDTAVVVSIGGSDSGQLFDVLVDEIVRGTASAGKKLTIFLEPYKMYNVRLRPRDGVASFDTAPKAVALYPGNVTDVSWKVMPLFILFGRAVAVSGKPYANADISGPHGIGRTDNEGYFQIEASRDDLLHLTEAGGASCSINIAPGPMTQGLVSAGDVTCQ